MSNGWMVEATMPNLPDPGEVLRLFYVREEDAVQAENTLLKFLGNPPNAKAAALTPMLATVLDDLQIPEGGVMEMP
jgi:hypothetical protein